MVSLQEIEMEELVHFDVELEEDEEHKVEENTEALI
jgi:hypothetical protein